MVYISVHVLEWPPMGVKKDSVFDRIHHDMKELEQGDSNHIEIKL